MISPHDMKCLSVALSLAAAFSGVVGAWYWLKASKVPTTPEVLDQAWHPSLIPVVLEENGWAWPFLQAVAKSAKLNGIAARWTAVSGLLWAAAVAVNAISN